MTGRLMPSPRLPRVLLVDDHEPLLAQLSELLREFGIDVVGTATDGADVVAAVRTALRHRGGVDVVLMDERMPRMNGLTATQHLKAAFPQVAVILHSAYANQLAAAPRRAGVVAEVVKGSHPSVLVGAITDACSTARALSAHAQPS